MDVNPLRSRRLHGPHLKRGGGPVRLTRSGSNLGAAVLHPAAKGCLQSRRGPQWATGPNQARTACQTELSVTTFLRLWDNPGPPDEVTMVREHLTVQPASPMREYSRFLGWVRDYQRPLLGFAQLIAGHPQTGEDLLQTALARAYVKWPKIGAAGQDPVGYVRGSSSTRTPRCGAAPGSAGRGRGHAAEAATVDERRSTSRGRPSAPCPPSTDRNRAALLRRSDRGGDRDRHGLLHGIGEDPHVASHRQAQADTQRGR